MRAIWIVKAGTTLPAIAARRGDFEAWITTGLGVPADRVRVASVYAGEALPAPDAPGAVVVSGSAAMVSDREPWSERAAAWLCEAVAAGTPVLGICYGHQLLAHGLGGRVGRNPRGREIGSVELMREDDAEADPLFTALPRCLRVHTTHQESVLELPPGTRRLAANAHDPNAAFAVDGRPAWGVQFHPEFDADIMLAYLDGRAGALRREGLDPDALRAAVRETPDGSALLRRFAALVRR